MSDGERNAAQMHPERTGMKARVHEEARHRVRGDRLAVDGGDQHALMIARAHSLLAERAQKMRQPRGGLRAFRLLGGQKDEQVGIATLEPRHKLAVAQNHFGVGGASEDARSRFRIFFGDGKIGPTQNRAIRVGGVSRGELHELGLLGWRFGAQLPQQVHRGRQRKLRGAQSADKIAAANAPALFERLQDVVDGAEPAGHILRGYRLAQQHAVAVEQLQRQSMAALGGCSPQVFGALPRRAKRQ